MIELKHVRTGYGAHTVLEDVSVSFEKGMLTCVIGVNGCGKSTLLKAMLRMIPLSGGGITVDGQGLETLPRSDIARKAAYLPQGKNTPDMTVEQLVLHGRFPHLNYPRRYTKEDHEIARRAMEQTGMTELAAKPLRALSGGMRQNAYIAMALAQNTDYVLLDEPTTYLDITRQLELMRTLRSLADGGKGIVAVMHDLPMAFAYADRIVLLHGGQVAGDDAPAKICGQSVIQDVFGVTVAPSPDGRGYHYAYPL